MDLFVKPVAATARLGAALVTCAAALKVLCLKLNDWCLEAYKAHVASIIGGHDAMPPNFKVDAEVCQV